MSGGGIVSSLKSMDIGTIVKQIIGVGDSLTNVSGLITTTKLKIQNHINGMVTAGLQTAVKKATEAANAAIVAKLPKGANAVSAKPPESDTPTTENSTEAENAVPQNSTEAENAVPENSPDNIQGGGRCCMECHRVTRKQKRRRIRRKTR
jgi:hypothetical protein